MKAHLILKDWSVYSGESFWSEQNTDWEVVFNTWMIGYPETLTDPSYRWQILITTYPLQWNYGVPDFNEVENNIRKHYESDSIHIRWLIVSEYSPEYSHWEASSSLGDFLKSQNIPAITWIDTRALTKKIREHWVILGKIVIWDKSSLRSQTLDTRHETLDSGSFKSIDKSFKKVVDPNNRDLVWEVSTKEPITYGTWKNKILLVDMWNKLNIIRDLLKYDTTIIRVPYDYPFMNWKLDFDKILISNWPGDPEKNVATIKEIQKAIKKNINIFGICLWNQILALAAWAKTYKLKYWHRWQNQPCIDVNTWKCLISSQNHWYAIDEKSLPKNVKVWFKNINDNTIEWIQFTNKPVRSVQFHPESTPGPNDSEYLFGEFIKEL